MGLYQDRILPHLVNFAMRNRRLLPYRKRVLSAAEGRVLEIGTGSGVNLPLYSDRIQRVIGLDPSPKLLTMAREATRRSAIPIELMKCSTEAIALEDESVDTVVMTWTLCTIPDATRALEEMRRVLKPGGQMLFSSTAGRPI